ncbi:uroporphyrinogen-III synthase [Bacillus salipaludis]|uniref:Uroporphyrinogen-III synthase n=1 Tax=Bacillus salipaludis TaxID=2547811 RepID=A0A4R5VWD3_9BACI|nr:uroporphyrinogen-III synthase [Bacillus salipaludis]MDQ6597184.1 uroporphyrinogen-III synthase [Bacillus salipaludis]TDK63367.1 uroporphyrinogen-III synthase [Bacillus salipaludis]
MEKDLMGKRIAITGSRKTEEISMLIKKQGGIPLVRSLQGTVLLSEKEVEPDLKRFVRDGADWVIFTTGMGTNTLYELAKKLDVENEFLQVIRLAKAASRGYKTLSALKELGVNPLAVDQDGTTRGLIQSLEGFDFFNKRVMVQLHGEQAPKLTKFLEDRGAIVTKLLPYKHIAPEAETITTICDELLTDKLDAVCFTTANQVRSLFDFAKRMGSVDGILKAFEFNTHAVAVGKVTQEALREEGIDRVITPENERMGAMVVELSRYYRTVNISNNY